MDRLSTLATTSDLIRWWFRQSKVIGVGDVNGDDSHRLFADDFCVVVGSIGGVFFVGMTAGIAPAAIDQGLDNVTHDCLR